MLTRMKIQCHPFGHTTLMKPIPWWLPVSLVATSERHPAHPSDQTHICQDTAKSTG